MFEKLIEDSNMELYFEKAMTNVIRKSYWYINLYLYIIIYLYLYSQNEL